MCDGGCISRDSALCLYILIFSIFCRVWDSVPTQNVNILHPWNDTLRSAIFLESLQTARTNPTDSTFKSLQILIHQDALTVI